MTDSEALKHLRTIVNARGTDRLSAISAARGYLDSLELPKAPKKPWQRVAGDESQGRLPT